MEGPMGAPQPYLDLALEEIFRPAKPEEMGSGPNPHGLPWETVIGVAIGVFTLLLLLWRGVQSVRSRLYLKREQKLALKLAELIEEKCKLLGKVSRLQKEYKGLEASLKDANSEKESKDVQILETINEMLNRCKSNVGDKIPFLEKEPKEEKSKHSKQDELMAATSNKIKSLEDESTSLKSQVAEAKTNLRIFQMSEEGLQVAIKEEKCLFGEERRLSEVAQKISHAAEELETCKKQAQGLDEELDRTYHFYERQIISYGKKARDNALAAWTADRNAPNSPKLAELEFKLELLQQDRYALDISNTAFGREHFPNGPSPLGQPSYEMRAFYLENKSPLRPSPLLREEGRREFSGGPENYLGHQIGNERREPNYHMLTDPHRAPADTGPLSPPREPDHKIMISPPGQAYSDPPHSLPKQDGYYSNYSRLSGPEELKSFNMLSLDKMDWLTPLEIESSGNDTKDDSDNSEVWDSSLPAEYQVSLLQKEHEDLESSLKDTNSEKESKEAQILETINEMLNRCKSKCLFGEERKLSEVAQKISHAAEELETCKKQAQGLDEELDRTYHFYERQIISYGKKTRDNALGAWAADSDLKNLRQVNAHSSEKLAELEFQLKLLQQEQYALDVSNTAFDREHFPNIRDDSNVPDSCLPAENLATGGAFIFSPLAPIRGPWLPGDPGSQFMRGGPFLHPCPPRNMYGESQDYFPPRPAAPAFPMQHVHSLRGFPHLPPTAGFFPPTPTFWE